MSVDQTYQAARAAQQAGRTAEAEQLYRAVLADQPEHADANRFLGILLLENGAAAAAEDHFLRALAARPQQPAYHQNLAMALAARGDFTASLAACERAIALKPDFALAWFNRGEALLQLARIQDALASFQRAATLGFQEARLFFAMGLALAQMKRRDEALACFQRTLMLSPHHVLALANGGILLVELGQISEALRWFDRALELDPAIAQCHVNRGATLARLHRLPEAIASFEKALALDPELASAHGSLALAYRSLGDHEKALACFDAALERDPGLPYFRSYRLYQSLSVCRWSNYESDLAALTEAMGQDGEKIGPFQILCLPTTAEQQLHCAKTYAAENCPPQPALPQGPRKPGRLRVGYLSKDFFDHPVTYLVAEVLERHERERLEIFALSHGPENDSAGRARIREAAEHFVDLQRYDDRNAARQLYDLGLDVVVDLDGHTLDARPGILAPRPARVQVNYLGYAGTMGASHIDYLVGDAVVTPPEHAAHYTEKLVQLPGCYLPASARPQLMAAPARRDVGLPENGLVFCAFNTNFKILPSMFALWMRLLAQVPHSVLWLRGDSDFVRDNLKREAAAHGIAPQRLVFAPRAGAKEHFARFQLADLFLDTVPYNAHTTAGDALWAGVPVITSIGDTFPGRVAASVLTVAGLPDLIAPSLDGYESLALSLADNPARLDDLKGRVRLARQNSPIFDSAGFVRGLESAFEKMSARHERGQPPEGFAVQS